MSDLYTEEEDENIRTDLGLGGMLMNFIVSPGQDTALLNRNLDKFIAGYAGTFGFANSLCHFLKQRIKLQKIFNFLYYIQ
jgi:hypothetical protein